KNQRTGSAQGNTGARTATAGLEISDMHEKSGQESVQPASPRAAINGKPHQYWLCGLLLFWPVSGLQA
ncbi:hypothetical protein ACP3W2_27420, partial [Salmonella enterica]